MVGVTQCDHDPPVRVYVGGEEIPVINEGVTTEIRKDGTADMNRLSTVYFPSHWNGENVEQAVDALNPDTDSVHQPAWVDMLMANGSYQTVHYGFTRTVGPGTETERERRLEIGDFSELVQNTEASQTFENATTQNVLSYVRDTFVQENDAISSLQIRGGNTPLAMNDGLISVDDDGILGGIEDALGSDSPNSLLRTPKEFTADRHTLRDVLDWLCKKIDSYWWIGYDNSGGSPTLIVDANPTRFEARGQNVSGSGVPVQIYENNALHTIQPLNAITVRGRTATSFENYNPWVDTAPSDKFPVATAVHTQMRDRAGGLYQPETITTDALTIRDAENQAKKELKQRLDNSTGGMIYTRLSPFLRPYTRLAAKPVCGDFVDHDVPPIDYEIEEIKHKVSATGRTETEASVSMYCDVADIQIENSTLKDA